MFTDDIPVYLHDAFHDSQISWEVGAGGDGVEVGAVSDLRLDVRFDVCLVEKVAGRGGRVDGRGAKELRGEKEEKQREGQAQGAPAFTGSEVGSGIHAAVTLVGFNESDR